MLEAVAPSPLAPADATPVNVKWLRIAMVSGLLVLFFIINPLLTYAGVVPDYKLNFLGKYLCFAIVALGIDLIWGYAGLLALCQAVFFCIGGYVMAMHLSLLQGGGDVRPEYNNIPQFMFFNNLRELPFFWKPFVSFAFTIVMGFALPALVAGFFGYFILRSRVRGVYFSIITQAVAWGAWLMVSRNEMLMGGTNGLTNFNKSFTTERSWIVGLYLTTLVVLVGAYFLCRAITQSRAGRVLLAVRDKESRLYFAGYQPLSFKLFAFAVGAMLAGVGGMLYSPQVGIITPQNMTVVASIDMVIWVALGGRGRLWGAILGALVVSCIYSAITSDMPTTWPFVQGMMYIGVVLLFPEGFVGMWDKVEARLQAHGWTRAGLTAVPLVSVSIFALSQALGLMPKALEVVIIDSASIGKIQVKYFILVGLIVSATIVLKFLSKRDAHRSGHINQPASPGIAGISTEGATQ